MAENVYYRTCDLRFENFRLLFSSDRRARFASKKITVVALTLIIPPRKMSAVETKSTAFLNPIENAKTLVLDWVIATAQDIFNVDLSSCKSDLVSKIQRPPKLQHGDLMLPCFTLTRWLKKLKPDEIAHQLTIALQAKLAAKQGASIVSSVAESKSYINFYLHTSYLGEIVRLILDGSFLAPLPSDGKMRCMIEYSQVSSCCCFVILLYFIICICFISMLVLFFVFCHLLLLTIFLDHRLTGCIVICVAQHAQGFPRRAYAQRRSW
jgi:hypothetical protein